MLKFWCKGLYLGFPLTVLDQTLIEPSSHWPKVIPWSVGHCDLLFSNLGHVKILMQGSISHVSFDSYWPNFNRTFLSLTKGHPMISRSLWPTFFKFRLRQTFHASVSYICRRAMLSSDNSCCIIIVKTTCLLSNCMSYTLMSGLIFLIHKHYN